MKHPAQQDRPADAAGAPAVPPPLDPGFQPLFAANRAYRAALDRAPARDRLLIALERDGGCVARHDLDLLPAGAADAATLRRAERAVKFLLWAAGGWRLTLAGPPALCAALRRLYAADGARAFDAGLMARAYAHPFEVRVVPPAEVPAARESARPLGGHWDGCRVGFDLGASDFKLAAVRDGEAVFTTEVPWNPSVQPDPQYHVRHIRDGLALAASHLPRVDAIGGSAAGIYVDNEPRVASLYRAVGEADFVRVIRPMFKAFAREWNVPLEVANDGDVTALAGGLTLGRRAVLGVAMGSSEAAGYLDPAGRITGWLNELAFAPVDLNPAAAADEWSGDRGVGALYFSQQAVARLAPAAGFAFPADQPLPERLKAVQAKADVGDPAALRIFETLGTCFGYALLHYAEFYTFGSVLVLGRVTSGAGGETLLAAAREVLRREDAAGAERVELLVPDERSRRMGQAVVAASLPAPASAGAAGGTR